MSSRKEVMLRFCHGFYQSLRSIIEYRDSSYSEGLDVESEPRSRLSALVISFIFSKET